MVLCSWRFYSTRPGIELGYAGVAFPGITEPLANHDIKTATEQAVVASRLISSAATFLISPGAPIPGDIPFVQPSVTASHDGKIEQMAVGDHRYSYFDHEISRESGSQTHGDDDLQNSSGAHDYYEFVTM